MTTKNLRHSCIDALQPRTRWAVLASGGLVLALTFIGAGCGSSSSNAPSSGGTGSTANTQHLELAFVTNNASDYWTIARAGTEKAKAELGVDVDFQIPDDGSAAGQKTIIDNLIVKGVQGIAISPVDPANETDMINDTAKKTLMFTVDSDAAKSDRVCYVGTDNVEAGKTLGEELKKALPNGGKIMMFVGKRDAQNAHDREEGVRAALAGSKITIADVRTDDADHAKAKSNAAAAIVANPDLVGMVGLWSYNGPAILSAVKDAQKVGKIKILCFDEEADTLAGIKDGSIDATVVQDPFEMGYESIKVMAQYLKGDKSAVPASKQVITPVHLITKDTVDAFKADLDKKLGK